MYKADTNMPKSELKKMVKEYGLGPTNAAGSLDSMMTYILSRDTALKKIARTK